MSDERSRAGEGPSRDDSRRDPASRDARIEALLAEREWVRRLALALSRDAHGGDDVAQQALAIALTHPPRHFANVRSWLGALVRSRARDAARAEARRERRERAASSVEGSREPTPHAARTLTGCPQRSGSCS